MICPHCIAIGAAVAASSIPMAIRAIRHIGVFVWRPKSN